MPGISKAETAQLEADIQYLNLAEMRAFCQAHDLPMYTRQLLS